VLIDLQSPSDSCTNKEWDRARDETKSITRLGEDPQTRPQGDVQAIKEVLDRIDGKTLAPAPSADDGPRQVNLAWKPPS
jgi:hypothetical protein